MSDINVSDLKSRSKRLALPIRTKPYFISIGGGRSIGYGRNKGAGSWVLRIAADSGARLERFARADDVVEANGVNVLSYRQALEKVSAERGVGEGAEDTIGGAVTVGDALDEYERDLAHRGGLVAQVARARRVLGARLLGRPVALLTHRELRRWRDSELERLAAGSVTRTCKTIKAALTYIAKQPEYGIKSHMAWVSGLESLPDSNVPRRGLLLSNEAVSAIVDACRAYDEQRLGLFVEVLAVTGCRASQVARLLVRDLKSNGVMMPRSMKGKGKKRMDRGGFPLPKALLERLHAAGRGRDGDEPLLQRADGGAWTAGALRHPWRSALGAAGVPIVIPYTLRYTSITRALKSGIAPAIVAKSRDTSVRIMEQVYGGELDQVSETEILGSLPTF